MNRSQPISAMSCKSLSYMLRSLSGRIGGPKGRCARRTVRWEGLAGR